MLTSRLIPCLDVRDGRVVKGVRFQNLRDSGDPVERARFYETEGADELVLLDISATIEGRKNRLRTIKEVRAALSIPLTVGGGVRSVEDAGELLSAGADRIAVNTAAVERPELLTEMAERYGRQCVVLAMDSAKRLDGWEVVTRSGTQFTGIDVLLWAKEAEALGAGEILLTSWDRDGTGIGYDLALLSIMQQTVRIPIIASGGASSPADMARALKAGSSAVLAASIFHDNIWSIPRVKQELANAGVEVRQ